MNTRSLPSADEIVNTLKRSNIPTIVIEGHDDVFIYRWLKSKVNISLISLLPCGGRNTLFSVHDRKNEFSNKNIIFLADKDMYRFEGIPAKRSDIIFTSGYCIENDIYEGSSIQQFLDDEDIDSYSLLKEIIIRWFAFEVGRYKAMKESGIQAQARVSTHINVISPPGKNVLCSQFSKKIDFVEPESKIVKKISHEFGLNVRGKQIFQMLARYLSKTGRFSSFNDKNLIEIALKENGNELISLLASTIETRLATRQAY